MIGPGRPGYSGPVEIKIDMSEVQAKLKIALEVYGTEVKNHALARALNRGCAPLLTAVRSLVTKQTSALYARVSAHIRADPAHAGSLTYKIVSKDTAMKLSEFRPNPAAGTQNPKIKVWNRTTTFHKAFVVSFGGKNQIVKRIATHPRNRGQPLGVKTMYGPIIPKEMLREGFASRAELERAIPERVLARLPHELEFAVAQAKAASGT